MLKPLVRRNGIAVLVNTKIKAGREVEGRNRKHPRSEERRGIFADRSLSRDLNIVKVGEGSNGRSRYHGGPLETARSRFLATLGGGRATLPKAQAFPDLRAA